MAKIIRSLYAMIIAIYQDEMIGGKSIWNNNTFLWFFCYFSYFQDLTAALKMLGLNPLEQEVLDLTNEVAKNGFIFFPEFCSIVHRKYREEDDSVFRQIMFKVNYSDRLGLSLAWLAY
jgi:hypothetical protein